MSANKDGKPDAGAFIVLASGLMVVLSRRARLGL
jgi:hypothetical protein